MQCKNWLVINSPRLSILLNNYHILLQGSFYAENYLACYKLYITKWSFKTTTVPLSSLIYRCFACSSYEDNYAQ